MGEWSQLEDVIDEMASEHGPMLVMVCAPDVPGALSEAFGWSSGSALSNILTPTALVRIERSSYAPPDMIYVMSEDEYEERKNELLNGPSSFHPYGAGTSA